MKAHCKQSAWLALAALLLVACGEAPDSGAELEVGQAPYLRYCASCHGQQGEGRLPSFPPLAGSEWLEYDAGALTAIVLLGLRGEIEVAGRRYAGYMPPMRHVEDADIAAIIGFIKRRWGSAEADWSGADVSALRESLSGRGMLEGRAGLNQLLEEME